MTTFTGRLTAPRFEEVLVEDDLKDGYWVQAADLTGDGTPDLVASGLAAGDVVWYENPTWEKRTIAQFDKPVSLDVGDVDGDGRADIVICHDYGNCMFNCGPGDGKISWLRNPGTFDAGEPWEARPVGDLVATHRLKLGAFTQPDVLEVLALPVVAQSGGPEAVHDPVRVTLFRRPGDPLGAQSWEAEVVDEETFRVIHGVVVNRFGRELDSVLLASEEGISWYGREPDGWRQALLGEGERTQMKTTGFQGSGNVDVGRIGDDPYAYIPTVEPFHGNTVAVYTKETDGTLADARWRRTILDVFGDPNERGEGAGHHVVTADFDGDGDDEFLVALRGPWPWQGVFYYKAIDHEQGLWTKTRVSTSSAARITVADFDGDGRPDFATTGYYTPGYFLAERPQTLVFLNRTGDQTR